MTDHAPSPSLYESGEYLARNPDWHEADAPHKAAWIAQLLARNAVEPRSIVEVGTGSGEVLVQLAPHFPKARLEGWDISPQAYEIAKAKARPGLEFHLGRWQPDGADLTMAIDVFEHVEDYFGLLREIKRAGGLKLFHIPLDLSVQSLLLGKSIPRTREQVGHIHYFYRDTALATLRDCGFRIIDWRYTHGAEELPHRQLRTRMFNVARRLARAINEDLAVRVMGGASMLVLAE